MNVIKTAQTYFPKQHGGQYVAAVYHVSYVYQGSRKETLVVLKLTILKAFIINACTTSATVNYMKIESYFLFFKSTNRSLYFIFEYLVTF